MLCMLGTPAGLLLGYFVGKLMLPMVMKVGIYTEEKHPCFRKSLDFCECRGVYGADGAFVCLEARKDCGKGVAHRGASLYRAAEKNKKEKKSRKGARVWRMAFSNLGRSKGADRGGHLLAVSDGDPSEQCVYHYPFH